MGIFGRDVGDRPGVAMEAQRSSSAPLSRSEHKFGTLYTCDSTFNTPFAGQRICPGNHKIRNDAFDRAQTTVPGKATTNLHQSRRTALFQYLVHVLRGQPKAERLYLENEVPVRVPSSAHCADRCRLYKTDLERTAWNGNATRRKGGNAVSSAWIHQRSVVWPVESRVRLERVLGGWTSLLPLGFFILLLWLFLSVFHTEKSVVKSILLFLYTSSTTMFSSRAYGGG